jgi:ABC-type transport system involved in cytochrome c biogenesis permease subunit
VRFILFLLVLFWGYSVLWANDETKINSDVFGSLTVQHDGRLKPVDTFARNLLLNVHTASRISRDRMEAVDWLWALVLYPEASYRRKDFKVREYEVLEAMKIQPREDHQYSFQELRDGVEGIRKDVEQWLTIKEEHQSLVQKHLLRLYHVMGFYYEVSRSLTLFEEDLVIKNEALASELGLKANHPLSFYLIHSATNRIETLMVEKMKRADWATDKKSAWSRLVRYLSDKGHDRLATSLTLISPKEKTSASDWLSPWEVMGKQVLSSRETSLLNDLQSWYRSRKGSDEREAMKSLESFRVKTGDNPRIKEELKYNRWDLFTKSLGFYLISLLLLMMSWLGWHKLMSALAKVSLAFGAGLHGYGMWMRMEIMERPPVSNLYESIIFVGWVAVLVGLIVELVRRNGLGCLCATFIGSLLHFVGFNYADDGDTMGMLVAVLDSNFWLATHVVTITMGYGITAVAGLFGHIYLIRAIWKPGDQTALNEIYKNSIGISLVALLFTTLGTILGGIWADQSWGRFWGWDPKENGALLIVLWLLMLLHGRLGGHFKALGFSVGLVLANITVALAWFGVNLLAVGLHNYGFTESIAVNLCLFCGFEALFALVGYVWADRRVQKMRENSDGDLK